MLTQVRCRCGKLLGEVSGSYRIVCPRCKSLVYGDTEKQEIHIKERPERQQSKSGC